MRPGAVRGGRGRRARGWERARERRAAGGGHRGQNRSTERRRRLPWAARGATEGEKAARGPEVGPRATEKPAAGPAPHRVAGAGRACSGCRRSRALTVAARSGTVAALRLACLRWLHAPAPAGSAETRAAQPVRAWGRQGPGALQRSGASGGPGPAVSSGPAACPDPARTEDASSLTPSGQSHVRGAPGPDAGWEPAGGGPEHLLPGLCRVT